MAQFLRSTAKGNKSRSNESLFTCSEKAWEGRCQSFCACTLTPVGVSVGSRCRTSCKNSVAEILRSRGDLGSVCFQSWVWLHQRFRFRCCLLCALLNLFELLVAQLQSKHGRRGSTSCRTDRGVQLPHRGWRCADQGPLRGKWHQTAHRRGGSG